MCIKLLKLRLPKPKEKKKKKESGGWDLFIIWIFFKEWYNLRWCEGVPWFFLNNKLWRLRALWRFTLITCHTRFNISSSAIFTRLSVRQLLHFPRICKCELNMHLTAFVQFTLKISRQTRQMEQVSRQTRQMEQV